jgi:hypothetical protein
MFGLLALYRLSTNFDANIQGKMGVSSLLRSDQRSVMKMDQDAVIR